MLCGFGYEAPVPATRSTVPPVAWSRGDGERIAVRIAHAVRDRDVAAACPRARSSAEHLISGGSFTTLTLISACASWPGTPSVATASNVSVPTVGVRAVKAKSPRAGVRAVPTLETGLRRLRARRPRQRIAVVVAAGRRARSWSTFFDARTVWVGITGAVVPCRRPTTWTSWPPCDVSVNATTVGGSGLGGVDTDEVATPRRRPSGAAWPVMGVADAAPTACTTTGCAQASVVAPASGGGAEADGRAHVAGARVPEVGGVDATAGRRRELGGDLVARARRVDLLRPARRSRRRRSTWPRTRARHRRCWRARRRSRGRPPRRRSASAGRRRRSRRAGAVASPTTTLGPTTPALGAPQ